MIETEVGMAFCNSCVHYGYCMVYWGIDCKRQGGTRIPKMKPGPKEKIRSETEALQISLNKPDTLRVAAKKKPDQLPNPNKNKVFKKFSEILEPIRTRVVNW